MTNPIAIVRCYSPNGTPTTVVTCYSAEAIVNAVSRAHRADRVHVRTVVASTHEYASSETAYGRTVAYGFAVKVF